MNRRRNGIDPVHRSRARRRALQAIYAWQMSGGLVEQVIAQFAHEQAHEIADLEYFDDLVRGVVKHRASLDEALVGYLDRPVEEVDPIERARTAADEASEAVETVLDDETLAPRLADAADQETLVVLARGPARAAAEMGALTLKECGVTAESYETAAFRHGPFELAGPGLGAVVVATEPETRSLDLRLSADLVGTGASVVVVSSEGEVPEGALGVRIPSVDRLLSPAVSIVPIQLLAWRLANARGRVPGVYTRASKVTTRE